MSPIYSHALAVTVEERIIELLKYRQWYRANPWARGPVWHEFYTEDRIELRALIRLARKARRAAEPVEAQQDAIARAMSYHDWQAVGPR